VFKAIEHRNAPKPRKAGLRVAGGTRRLGNMDSAARGIVKGLETIAADI
jgi:hypothetical protein